MTAMQAFLQHGMWGKNPFQSYLIINRAITDELAAINERFYSTSWLSSCVQLVT
jgi:hypothetical protein